MISALICDLDMTLINSKADIAMSFAYAMNQTFQEGISAADIYPLIGRGLKTICDAIFPPDWTNDEFETFIKNYQEYYWEHCDDTTTPFPDVITSLIDLRTKGVKIGVATNKMTFIGERVCDKVGLSPYIDHIQGTDGTTGKPNPLVILTACRRLGVKPDEAILIGDSVNDIKGAKNAGCAHVVAVTYGAASRDELVKANPDYIIDHFEKVIEFFKR